MLTDCKTEQFSRILIISPGSAAVSSIFYLSFSAITYLDKAADDFLAHPSKPQAISRNWFTFWYDATVFRKFDPVTLFIQS